MTRARSPRTALLGLAVLATSCSGGETSAAGAATPPAVTAAPDEPLLLPSAAPVPTAEEAAKRAEATITEENADAELEKLKRELEDG